METEFQARASNQTSEETTTMMRLISRESSGRLSVHVTVRTAVHPANSSKGRTTLLVLEPLIDYNLSKLVFLWVNIFNEQ